MGAARQRQYQEALGSLLAIIHAIKDHPRVMPIAVMQEFAHNVAAHLRALAALNLHLVYKHHFLIEMAGRFRRHVYRHGWGSS